MHKWKKISFITSCNLTLDERIPRPYSLRHSSDDKCASLPSHLALSSILSARRTATLPWNSFRCRTKNMEQSKKVRRLKFARTACQSVLRVRFQLFIFLLSRTTVLFHFFSSLFFFSFSRFCHERDVICGRRMTHFDRLTALWNYFTASFNSRFSPLPN